MTRMRRVVGFGFSRSRWLVGCCGEFLVSCYLDGPHFWIQRQKDPCCCCSCLPLRSSMICLEHCRQFFVFETDQSQSLHPNHFPTAFLRFLTLQLSQIIIIILKLTPSPFDSFLFGPRSSEPPPLPNPLKTKKKLRILVLKVVIYSFSLISVSFLTKMIVHGLLPSCGIRVAPPDVDDDLNAVRAASRCIRVASVPLWLLVHFFACFYQTAAFLTWSLVLLTFLKNNVLTFKLLVVQQKAAQIVKMLSLRPSASAAPSQKEINQNYARQDHSQHHLQVHFSTHRNFHVLHRQQSNISAIIIMLTDWEDKRLLARHVLVYDDVGERRVMVIHMQHAVSGGVACTLVDALQSRWRWSLATDQLDSGSEFRIFDVFLTHFAAFRQQKCYLQHFWL